jgi:hypothetical protein
MKLWHTIFIATFIIIIIYGALSLRLLGGWVVERVRGLRHSHQRPCLRKCLSSFLLALLIGLAGSVGPIHAASETTVTNLRGDRVRIPMEVPPRERFVLRRLISVEDRLIVFLYHDPRFRHPVDYAETYNLTGELLEVVWIKPAGGFGVARDINLGNRKATGPARILEIIDVPEEDVLPDATPDVPTGDGRPTLQMR